MTAATQTLADFLLARIAEDEAAARNATLGPWEAWSGADAGGGEYITSRDSLGYTFGISPGVSGDEGYAIARWDAAHIARHDPARVLAECEAKRNLVNYAAFMLKAWTDKPGGAYPDMTRRERHTANVILEQLAAVYADHEDYREEWRP